LWKKDELKGRTRLCARLILDPGSSIGFHEHVDEEEVYIITRGTGLLHEAEGEVEVFAGDTILTGDGAGHSIAAVGDQPLEIIAVIVQYG
jgi:mannose-6-phosphate isomerase-like protein (cupin superfamily)